MRGLLQYAGGHAVGIGDRSCPPEVGRLWKRRCSRAAGPPSSRRHSDPSCVPATPDSAVRPIEIGRRQIAPLGELAFVPPGALQPFAGLELGDSGFHAPHRLGDRRCIAEPDVIQLVHSASAMCAWLSMRPGVAVRPCKSMPPRARSRETKNLAIRADCGDLAVTDRQGCALRVCRVDGQDRAMKQDRIGVRLPLATPAEGPERVCGPAAASSAAKDGCDSSSAGIDSG